MQRSTLSMAVVAILGLAWWAVAAERTAEPLPGTAPLTWTDDLSVRIVDEAHRFLDRKTAESIAAPPGLLEAGFLLARSLREVDRAESRTIQKDARRGRPAACRSPWSGSATRITRRWSPRRRNTASSRCAGPCWKGWRAKGCFWSPKGRSRPSPSWSPTPTRRRSSSWGWPPVSRRHRRRLAPRPKKGCRVVVPMLVSRACEFSGNSRVRMTNQPHREWIYRQAFEMGRHVIGYEVQKVLAAVDWFDRRGPQGQVGRVAGYAEGGLIALCRGRARPADRLLPGERLFRLAARALGGADLPQRVRLVARVRRRRDRLADRSARVRGRGLRSARVEGPPPVAKGRAAGPRRAACPVQAAPKCSPRPNRAVRRLVAGRRLDRLRVTRVAGFRDAAGSPGQRADAALGRRARGRTEAIRSPGAAEAAGRRSWSTTCRNCSGVPTGRGTSSS